MRLVGKDSYSIQKHKLADFISGNSLADYLEMITQSNYGKQPKNVETEILSANGTNIIVEWTRLPGDHLKIFLVGRDVTVERKLDQKQKQLNDILLEIISLVPHPVFFKDAQGKYTLVNEAQHNIYPDIPEGLIGKTDADIIDDQETLEIIQNTDKKVINEKVPVEIKEQIIIHKDGTSRNLITHKIPYHNKITGEVNILGISIDQTEIKNTQFQLKNANNELDTFLYRSTHDLRAPLSTVLGLLTISERKDHGEEEQKQYFDMMKNQVLRLDNSLKTITEYSKNRTISLDIKKIDIKDLIESAIEQVYQLNGEENIDITLDILSPYLYSDKERLSRAIMNILSNAIHFKKENANVHLDIKVYSKNNHTHLEFKDNGTGIMADQLPLVFDMFHRASIKSKGAGLGLYITKKIVEKLDGKISIDSKERNFTKVTISLKQGI